MRAIVTGGLGFIGSHLVDRLLSDGHRVVVIDDDQEKPDLWGGEVEIQRIEMQWSPLDADIVYHLAGPVGPVGVLEQGGEMAPEIIAMAQQLTGRKSVYVSTSEIYGEQPQPITEDAPRIFAAGYSARMEYAVAKLAGETILLNSDADVRIVRPFNVAGPRQKAVGGFVLPRFIEQAKAGVPLTVYQPGTQRRAFTHVLDIVDGIVAASEAPAGSVYNLGNPDNEASILELAEEVIDALASPSTVEVIDPVTLWGVGFVDAPDKVPDISKARTELTWSPTISRRTTIMDAAWHRS